MNSESLRRHLRPAAISLVAAMAATLLTPGAPALAQGASASQTPTAGAVTVVAPRVVRREVAGSGKLDAPIEVLQLQRTVNFADLDLTTQSGVDEFEKRILYASLAACEELEAEYPSNIYVPAPASQNCPETTAKAALSVADDIIAAARNHGK